MAGSRVEKVGTVFTRVRDLMRSGVVKESNKPVWFDVYTAFPPKRDPVYVKPVRRVRRKTEENVPEIFYKEDEIRAKFYQMYGNGPKAFDLTKTGFVSTCQRFVEKYSELESRGDLKPETLLDETAKALLADGVVLRRRAGGPASYTVVMVIKQEATEINICDHHRSSTNFSMPEPLNTPGGPVSKLHTCSGIQLALNISRWFGMFASSASTSSKVHNLHEVGRDWSWPNLRMPRDWERKKSSGKELA
ncbi:28S ribosomal protein S23, mitochondrial [Silurus asotus]|uniref:Small ribosomal subunit protein mS23 n=1 Tax=Silurus asotus TaxID=30991 RepID=A0AAD5B240_SILAS|nr:28S ribosomal protein S23, mitochondrial [Silurus asotus]